MEPADQRRFLGGHLLNIIFFFFFFQLYNAESLPTSNMNSYKKQKEHSIMFILELSSKSVGVAVAFTLLKENLSDPHFFQFFFLKGKIIVFEIKTNL